MDATSKTPAGGPGLRDYAQQFALASQLYRGDPRMELMDAIREAGIAIAEPDRIVADGSICRFQVEGDKHGSRDGWAVLFAGLHGAGGAFGHWRTGVSGTWHARGHQRGASARKRMSAAIAEVQRQHEAERLQRAHEAQQRALRLWKQAAAADPFHPYLLKKKVAQHGVRQLDDKLVIPARDADGTLWTLEFIYPDGDKRFLSGGRKRGCYFAIGRVADELLVAEGFATAASLHEATGKAVAVAFDAGNLDPVARCLRAKFPGIKITIAADNDTGTSSNPGLTKATAAARAVGGYVAIPPDGYNDFNDVAVAGANA